MTASEDNYDFLYVFLRYHRYPNGFTKCDKRALHCRAMNYKVESGHLFYYHKSGQISLYYCENSSHITYIQHAFRNHLLSCIDKKILPKFPSHSRTRKSQLNCQITYNIYCVCRLPDSGRMICCSLCNKWYHNACVTTPKKAWKKRNSEWFCDSSVL